MKSPMGCVREERGLQVQVLLRARARRSLARENNAKGVRGGVRVGRETFIALSLSFFLSLHKTKGRMADDPAPTEVCIVIGASRGLGAAIAAELARRDPGCPVLATMRRSPAAPPAPPPPAAPPGPANLTPVPGIDIASDACVAALQAALGDRLIRTLIISAAEMLPDEGCRSLLGKGGAGLAAVESQFQANALGPVRVAAALAGRIRPGGKCVLVASRTGLPSRIRAAGTGGMVGYRASKAAAAAVGLILAADLAPQGVAVASIHPGTILTDMYRAWHGLKEGEAPPPPPAAAAAGGGAPAAGVIAPRTHAPVTPELAASRFLDIVESRVSLETTGRVWDEQGREMVM